MDPESFVDPGYSLTRKVTQIKVHDREKIIWRHIHADKSPNLYYVSQDYQYRIEEGSVCIYEDRQRSYSFHGLYRKFSETDLFEAIRVKSFTMRNKPMNVFDK